MQLKLEKGLYDAGSIEKKPLCHVKVVVGYLKIFEKKRVCTLLNQPCGQT